MSNKIIFTVRDSKVGVFGPPLMLRSTGEAIRLFTQLITNPESNVSKFPEDFSLHSIGEYDEVKGEMIPLPHISFGSGTSFLPPRPATTTESK